MPPQFLRDFKSLTIKAVKVLRYFILVTPFEFCVLDKLKKSIIFYLTLTPIFKKIDTKTEFYQMNNIMTIPAYSIWYPEIQILTLNISATVIFIFIVFNYFEAFSENMYDQPSMYKMGFPC